MITAKEYGKKQSETILNADDDELVYLALFWINRLSVNHGSEYKEYYYSICNKLGITKPRKFNSNLKKFEDVGILEQDGGSLYVEKNAIKNIELSLSDKRVSQIFKFIEENSEPVSY